MARKRRQAVTRGGLPRHAWGAFVVLAGVSLLLAHVVFPATLSKHPVTAALLQLLVPLGDFVAMGFALTAVTQFLAARKRNAEEQQAPVSPHHEPAMVSASRRPSRAGAVRTDPVVPQTATPLIRAWSLDILQQVEWKRFEDLCAAYYQEKGIHCRTTPLGPDGGIDIRLYQDATRPEQTTAVVQCKATRRVGVKPMRELLGVMVHEKLDKSFFMTSGEFTDEAKAFGQQNHIVPMDGKLILAMIRRLPEEGQQRLLTFATQGDWTTPTCPECGRKMQRKDPVGQKPFWSCKRGRCKGRLDMRFERF